MDRYMLEKIAEKLGYPPPENENEEQLLILEACSRLGCSVPDCENEEEILYRWVMEKL